MLAVPDDVAILQATIVKNTRSVNRASVERGDASSHTAAIDFDFLDPGDGFSISVIHTADMKVLGIKGTVIGLKRGLSRVAANGERPSLLRIVFSNLAPALFLIGGSALMNWWAPASEHSGLARTLSGSLFVIGAALAVLFSITGLPRRGWRRRPCAIDLE